MERLVYIIRHGATDWNQAGRIQGHLDPPLNTIGRTQAHLVGQRLAQFGATALYSSDLQRAYQTAQAIAQATGLDIVQKFDLREIHFGAWQGLTVQQIRERDPDVYAARRANPYDVTPAGGETWRQFYNRAIQVLHEILATTQDQRLILVTHGGVCTALGLRAQGLDCTGKRTFGNDNCSIHTIAVAGERWGVVSLNDVAHLQPDSTPAVPQSAHAQR
jgi:broad specificity phosphatase PhoE